MSIIVTSKGVRMTSMQNYEKQREITTQKPQIVSNLSLFQGR